MRPSFTIITLDFTIEEQIAEYRHRIAVISKEISNLEANQKRARATRSTSISQYKQFIRQLDPAAVFGYRRVLREPCLLCAYFRVIDGTPFVFPIMNNYDPLQLLWTRLDRHEKLRAILEGNLTLSQRRRVQRMKDINRVKISQLLKSTCDLKLKGRPLFPTPCSPSEETITFLGEIEGDPWFAQLCEAPPEARPSEIIAPPTKITPRGYKELMFF